MNQLFSLKHRTALVTGASDGLGARFAQTLGQAGARVVLAARRKNALDEQVQQLRDQGIDACAVAMDVSDSTSVDAAFQTLDDMGWSVDVLINNAGQARSVSWLETSEEDWQAMLQVNLLGADRVARAVCKRLVNAGRPGRVVNVSSVLGITHQPFTAAYGSAKAALLQLTRKMAVELASHNIQANAIAPGLFHTAMVNAYVKSGSGKKYMAATLSKRAGTLDELDGTLLFLASDASAYVTGVVIPVDGGNHLRGL
ncbi:SDR family NAD(P)-dependent oxidoreductase [Comamonas thiooxydans]|uniref:SDR family NAD(P)-dependent oxidoreductase n=1 Tax=Comamonas thiooxydans TaxID=363952 RepID=UPI00209BC4FC|nr:SDR family oxidoreductase [Comamonas thiooxydans]